VTDMEWLAGRFEEQRPRLRAVAYRMLGSVAEADDAVQDAWERVSRAGTDEVGNLSGWLTTIVARVCLNMLRSREVRREEAIGIAVPDPIVNADGQVLPVLHDMFDLPFEEIGRAMGRTTQAARQLASRGRQRVRGAEIPAPERDLARQRAVDRRNRLHR
jgi:DNA-directed RNA polymerase specialized sigma24 family protein